MRKAYKKGKNLNTIDKIDPGVGDGTYEEPIHLDGVQTRSSRKAAVVH